MKKTITVLILPVFIFALAGCSGERESTDAATPAQILLDDFREQMKKGDDMSAEEIAEALVSNDVLPFSAMTMKVEEGYLNGFSNEITGFADASTFGPVIGSIPFVGYIFKLDSSDDTDAFVKTLKDSADLRWNICTQADEMLCEAYGDTVFFVMSPLSFDE